MNTTSSTFERDSVTPDAGPYTVVGGNGVDTESKNRPGLSIVLVNRGSRQFRRDLFDELCKIGAREVISLESSPCPYDVDALVRRHENLRFIVFSRSSNTGARIDAAFREAVSDHVFVLHGDMTLKAADISSRVFAKIADRNRVCTVPVFRDGRGELLPSVIGPVPGSKGQFDFQPVLPESRELPTLVPWDYAGIYKKDLHMAVGGFDARIEESWWQVMEYGMRCWLFGDGPVTHPSLRVGYLDYSPSLDASTGAGYRRFFLKTLAIRFRGGMARLPRARWWAYMKFSGESATSSRETWKEIRHWVQQNQYRFRRDAASLTRQWDWGNGE
ncbi:MAG: hypothetical protein MI717_01100 [Spirochaetales bacterium]|nr:hypothetical protein [Spirochaetales bacterium]